MYSAEQLLAADCMSAVYTAELVHGFVFVNIFDVVLYLFRNVLHFVDTKYYSDGLRCA